MLQQRHKGIRDAGCESINEIFQDNLNEDAAFELEVIMIRELGREKLGKGPLP